MPQILQRVIGDGRVGRAQIDAFFVPWDTILLLLPAGGDEEQGGSQQTTKRHCDFPVTDQTTPHRCVAQGPRSPEPRLRLGEPFVKRTHLNTRECQMK